MMPVFNEIVEVNAEVYRNMIGIDSVFDEFDDLSSDAITKKYAHQITTSSSNQLSSHDQAIDYIFRQAAWLPTRFGTGQYPVWYASMDLITSFYETLYHWKRIYLEKPSFKVTPKIIKTIRSVYTVECRAALIDLRNKSKEYPELVHPDPECYEITQKWGLRMHKEGYPGFLTYSARQTDGENVVVFKDKILTNAKHYHDYIYEYNMVSEQEIVRSNITNDVLLRR